MKVFRVIKSWCKKVFRKIKGWMIKPFRKKAKPGPEEKDTPEYGTGMKSQKHLLIRAAQEVYIDIYGYYAKIIFNKTYFNKDGFSKKNH